MKKFLYLFFLVIFLSACQNNSHLKSSLSQKIIKNSSPTLSAIMPTLTQALTETATLTPPPLEYTATPTTVVIPITETPWPISTVRFAVIGDYGTAGNALKAVSELVNSWEPDFIITTGDNNYPAGGNSTIDENIGYYFSQYIFPYQGSYGDGAEINRFFPTLGNHDWIINDAQPYLDYFTLPGNERYYDFQWAFIHFFALDSDWDEPDGNRESSVQAAWLKQGLEDSNAPWKIVFMHHAPYASGTRAPMIVMRWPYEEWGADIVLGGHDHHYERLIIDDFPYFVNGLGGASKYDIGEILLGSQITYRDNWGAMLVEATPYEVILQFITIDGEVIDSFSLSKYPLSTN